MGVSLAGPKGRRGWEIELAGQGWVVQTGSGYFCSFLFIDVFREKGREEGRDRNIDLLFHLT